MALFGTSSKKKTPKAKGTSRKPEVVKDAHGTLATALLRPWLSEKALIGTEKGVYVFRIPKDATKRDVMLAVEKFYKVVPRQIRVVNLPPKKVSMRKRRGFGTQPARRKAYVYLKTGDTIQFA